MKAWNGLLLVVLLSVGLPVGLRAADPAAKPASGDKAAADKAGADDLLPGYQEVKVASLRAMLPDLKDKKITFVACYDTASTDIYGPVNDSGYKNGRDYNLSFRLATRERGINGPGYYSYSYINGYAKHTKDMSDMVGAFDAGQWVRVYGTVHKTRSSHYGHEQVTFIEIEQLKAVPDPTNGTGAITPKAVTAPATPPVGGPPVGGGPKK